MVKRVKVRLFGFQNRQVDIDADATEGALIGTNLRWPDGSLVSEAELRNITSTETTTGGSSTTLWDLIVNIPTIIRNLQYLQDPGLMAHLGSGDIAARTIAPEDERITVTNGDGVSGNPTVGLTDWPPVKESVESGETAIIQPGFQLLVNRHFDVVGTLDCEGTLVVL